MDRDPTNHDGTRDPIFLLQGLRYTVFQLPDGISADGETYYVDDLDNVPDWVRELLDDDRTYVEDEASFERQLCKEYFGEYDTPCAIERWDVEGVYLTRDEAETFAKSHTYRYSRGWRVYCTPCDGALARILARADQRAVEKQH